jgi:hypothetical protein
MFTTEVLKMIIFVKSKLQRIFLFFASFISPRLVLILATHQNLKIQLLMQRSYFKDLR